MPARPRTTARRAGILATVLLGACLAATANAGSVRSGDCTIHYNALSGDALPLASTRAYGLRHSSDQGLVTIAVNTCHGSATANVPFTISGHATTLLGRKVPIKIRYIGEHGSHSALVTFHVSDGETIRFDLDVNLATHNASTTRLHFVHSYEP